MFILHKPSASSLLLYFILLLTVLELTLRLTRMASHDTGFCTERWQYLELKLRFYLQEWLLHNPD